MDKAFKQVEPLATQFLRVGLDIGAHDKTVVTVCDRSTAACVHFDIDEAIALRDWLIAATGRSVPELNTKRFYAVVIKENNVSVWDEDFGYDAALNITGDFETHEQRLVYAEAIALALNSAAIPTAPSFTDTEMS